MMVLALFAVSGTATTTLAADGAVDAYLPVADATLKSSYAKLMEQENISSTDKLFAHRIDGCIRGSKHKTIHAVQDRGLPRGPEYPTFVFVSEPNHDDMQLIQKAFAGRHLYFLDETACRPDACLLSAEKGYSDICLADGSGSPGENLPGLRQDFWSDLLKLFGL
ncbi:hypothetical protein K1718_01625 [Roseibium porphyridii]|uniref:Uncharacterized protein n=1 Tax=Roseibium porphyridii TaxID=2866279 RepID=A0ABY8F3J5_9HYPH|nr:hypothetical protein [Roseibium sp. KMA01]WFE90073.1 hypothetical protein K1718_01625 [Roseibium sp. KMA01]